MRSSATSPYARKSPSLVALCVHAGLIALLPELRDRPNPAISGHQHFNAIAFNEGRVFWVDLSHARVFIKLHLNVFFLTISDDEFIEVVSQYLPAYKVTRFTRIFFLFQCRLLIGG